ncbi:bifunctional folylpolyglutamate synthase/dihydrofolate synthase [bacterium]|nr:bifunctional folylpolyglutamate synthase/dihydrofolate synthase [bacterium]
MTYPETLNYIFNLHRFGIKPGLDNIRKFCRHLGDPQDKFRSIHIAGTNGKGSVTATVASIIGEVEPDVGIFTSPHLVSFRERIKIGRNNFISKDYIIDFINDNKSYLTDNGISFFETITAMAFCYFRDNNVPWGVFETGLGGEYDATNVLLPELAIITRIGFDHTRYLGNDLPSIARQKAGIIKGDRPTVLGSQDDELSGLFRSECSNRNSKLYNNNVLVNLVNADYYINGSQISLYLPGMDGFRCFYPLCGDFQVDNLLTSLTAVRLLNQNGLELSLAQIKSGIEKLYWPGRFEILSESPFIIADVAHNEMSFNSLIDLVNRFLPKKRIFLLLGMAQDKDLTAIARCLKRIEPEVLDFVTVKPLNPRACGSDELSRFFNGQGFGSRPSENIGEAVREMLESLKSPRAVALVTGSHYTVGETINELYNLRAIDSELISSLGFGYDSEVGIGAGL